MLGVIGAMTEEVQLMRAQMTDVTTSTHAQTEFMQGTYKGTEIALAQSGIGKVNATICTQIMIDLFKPKKMVFSGLCGANVKYLRFYEVLPNMPKEIFEKLRAKGIFVRWFDKDKVRDFLRISIGTDEEMKKLISCLEIIINKEK